MSMNNIMIVSNSRHEEGVDVNFSEECRNGRDNRRDMIVSRLSSLARMASRYKPFDVSLKQGLPEVCK